MTTTLWAIETLVDREWVLLPQLVFAGEHNAIYELHMIVDKRPHDQYRLVRYMREEFTGLG